MLSVTGANFTPDNGSVIYNDLAVLLQTCPGPSFCLRSAHGAARAPAAGEQAWCWQTSEQGRISAGASHLAGTLRCQASHSELLFVNAAYGVLGLCHAHLAALWDISALLQLLVAVWPHERLQLLLSVCLVLQTGRGVSGHSLCQWALFFLLLFFPPVIQTRIQEDPGVPVGWGVLLISFAFCFLPSVLLLSR